MCVFFFFILHSITTPLPSRMHFFFLKYGHSALLEVKLCNGWRHKRLVLGPPPLSVTFLLQKCRHVVPCLKRNHANIFDLYYLTNPVGHRSIQKPVAPVSSNFVAEG